MTIEQLIVQCLYENKTVTLQNVGTFILSPELTLPDEGKETDLSLGTIEYIANQKVAEDPVLIDFISLHSRKMRSLAQADLESYIILQKQFLNIGKPLIIPGLGSLQKDQNGEFSFIQGKSISRHIDKLAEQKDKVLSDEISFKSEQKKKKPVNKIIVVAVLIIILLGGAAIAYYLLVQKNKDTPVKQEEIVVTKPILPLPDTVAVTKTDHKQEVNDSSVYKVVVRKYDNEEEANKVATSFRSYGHTIEIVNTNSVYELAIPFFNNINDTTRVLDSLQKFFNFKTYILR